MINIKIQLRVLMYLNFYQIIHKMYKKKKNFLFKFKDNSEYPSIIYNNNKKI